MAHSHAVPVAGALHAGGAHRGGGVRGVDVGAAVGRRVHEHDAALPRRRHRPQRGARAREARAAKNHLSSSSSLSLSSPTPPGRQRARGQMAGHGAPVHQGPRAASAGRLGAV